jgi:hypothetical protein
LPANEVVLEWLNLWIEYFTEMKTVDTNGNMSEFIRNTNTFLHEYIKNFDILDSNIAELRGNLSLLMENVSDHVSSKLKEISDRIYSSISTQESGDRELNQISQSIIERLEKSEEQQVIKVVDSMKKSQISIKHKLKLSIPLFLFTKYEGEIEFATIDKIPRNLRDLKNLIFKED